MSNGVVGRRVARVQVAARPAASPLTVTRPCASQHTTWSPGIADDPLDEVLLATAGRSRQAAEPAAAPWRPGWSAAVIVHLGRERVEPVEDDDVAALDVAQVVDDLVDQHPVADLQRVLHRPGRDVERLDQERLEQDRQQRARRGSGPAARARTSRAAGRRLRRAHGARSLRRGLVGPAAAAVASSARLAPGLLGAHRREPT